MLGLHNPQLKHGAGGISAILLNHPCSVIIISSPPSAKLFCCKTRVVRYFCFQLTFLQDKREGKMNHFPTRSNSELIVCVFSFRTPICIRC